MTDKKLNDYARLKELSDLCVSALRQLEDTPDNQELRQTVQSTFQSLRTAWPKNIPSSFPAEMAAPGRLKTKKLREFRLEVEKSFRRSFATLFDRHVNSIQFLNDADAEYLFGFLDEGNLTLQEECQLALNVCEKSGFSAPMETFEHIMRVLERHPQCLSGEHTPHPGYVYRPTEQRTFDRCPVCGGTGAPYFCSFSYRIANFSNPHLPAKLWMRCEDCQNLFTWKFAEEFLSLSGKDVELLQPNPEHYVVAAQVPAGLSIWSRILGKLQNYTQGDSLLEIGPGQGELTAVALETGYNVETIEIVPEDAQRIADLLNIPVWRGDFLNFTSEKRYDIIIMGDVIEHVLDPEAALRKAADLLADGGVLWLSTPNFESSFSRMLKFQDPMWREPYHITYFSYRGFAPLAEKCGFEIQDYSVSNRYNGSMELVLTKRN